MQNSQPPAPEKGSKPVHCDSLSRSIPTFESSSWRESQAPEKEDGSPSNDGCGDFSVQRGETEANGGRGGEASSAALADQNCLLEEVSSNDSTRGGNGEQAGGNRHAHHGIEDDDEGYHTPTSPSRRIPANLSCPPAPKKARPGRLGRKRKAGRRFYRVVWRRLQLPLEVEMVICPAGAARSRARWNAT